MNFKSLFWAILLAGLFSISHALEAQTRVPGTGGSTNSTNSNNPIENNSLFGERTTKKGLTYRPIFIPFIGGGYRGGNTQSFFRIDLNPMGGVAINKFRIAAGPLFEYSRVNNLGNVTGYRGLGANAFTQYQIINLAGGRTQIFAHAEYAFRKLKDLSSDFTQNVHSLPLGGGFSQPISGRTSFQGIILYDPLNDSPYNNGGLSYRFGIGIGF